MFNLSGMKMKYIKVKLLNGMSKKTELFLQYFKFLRCNLKPIQACHFEFFPPGGSIKKRAL